MKITTHKQVGFGNRICTVTKDYLFNGQTIEKGLRTDGGSVPKIFIIGMFLILNSVYDFHWLTNIIIFAIAIDESSGWFQKAFFLHDQDWQNAISWGDIWKGNWVFAKNMFFIVRNYKGNPPVKMFFHIPLGFLLTIIYPLALSTFALIVAYIKLNGKYNNEY